MAYNTGPQQQVFAVVSGYLTEPTDVITSPLQKLAAPQPPPSRKGSQAEKGAGRAKLTVNLNSGFIIAFDIGYAIDAIHKSPVGPLRNRSDLLMRDFLALASLFSKMGPICAVW